MLGDLVPDFIKIVNENGVSLTAIGLCMLLGGLCMLLGGFGISAWFSGSIATHCFMIAGSSETS